MMNTADPAHSERRPAFTWGLPAPRMVTLKDGHGVVLRAAAAEDGPAVQTFVRGLSPRSRHNRFFAPVRDLSPDQLDRVTRSQPPGSLALLAETSAPEPARIVAMAQYVACDFADAEFAIVVDDAWQRQGLGLHMLAALAVHAGQAGLNAFAGYVLADNRPMRALLARFNCEISSDANPYLLRISKRFDAAEVAALHG